MALEPLNIITLSDLTTLDGTKILPNILHGKQFRSSTITWPNQEIPMHWWSSWESYLTSYIVPYIALHPLGNWISPTHQQWNWFQLSPTSILNSDGQIFTATSSSRQAIFHRSSAIAQPSLFLLFVDVVSLDDAYKIISSSPPFRLDPISPPSFDYTFLHSHERFHRKTNRKLKRHLRRGTALIATDGSAYQNEKASYSSIITTPKGKVLYSNYGPVLSDPEYLASDRAELMALLSILTRLPRLYSSFCIPFPQSPLHIYSDSEVSIKHIRNPSKFLHFSSTFINNADIILEIHAVIKASPIKFHFHHVTSHQDEHLPSDSLSLPATINIEADRIADLQYLQPITQHHRKMPHLPAQAVSFSSPFHRLTNNTSEEIVRLHRDSRTEETLIDHWNISPSILHKIEWYGLKKTFESQPPFSASLAKTFHSQWDTQERKKRWKQSTSDLCPLCHTLTETCDHVLRCPHSVLSTTRADSFRSIIKSLQSIHTAPLIIRRIQYLFQRWTSHQQIRSFSSKPSHLHKLVKSALKSQKSIGIFNFFKGIISSKWIEVQQEYCRVNKFRFRTTWSTKLITALLRHAHLMWTSRCKLIHLDNVGTFEQTCRTEAYQYLQTLKADPSQIGYRHRSLLRRSYDFFTKASFPTIQMWLKRTKTAVAYTARKNRQLGTDIRNWVLIRPHDPGRWVRGARIPKRRRLCKLSS